jgi:hypothetical protein
MRIPDGYAPFTDAVFRAIDPRLTSYERDAALEQAAAEPEYALGLLTELLAGYHKRAETMAGYARGHYVDQLRMQAFGTLDSKDVLGYAINDAQAGEEVRFTVVDPAADVAQRYPLRVRPEATMVPRPAEASYFEKEHREGRGPESLPAEPAAPRSIGDVAAQAEADRRRSLEEELMGGAVREAGHYPGIPDPSVPPGVEVLDQAGFDAKLAEVGNHPFPVEDVTQNGGTPIAPADPKFAGLLDSLDRQRRGEAAVDEADPDDPRTMPGDHELADALGQTGPQPSVHPLGAGPSRTYPPRPAPPTANGAALCGHQTKDGPCNLTAGHPEMTIPGTENGHLNRRNI